MVKKKQPAKKEAVRSAAGIDGSTRAEQALKESEQNYRLLAAYHKQLNDISISFSEAVDAQDLFNKIAETLRLLTGAVASSFSVYEQETRELKVVSLSIDPVKQDKVSTVFGPDILGMRIPVSADDLEHMLNHGIRRPKDLHELSSGLIPRDLSDALMDAAGCRQIVALAVTYATELTGTCVAYLPADQPVVPDEALKTYIYLSGLAIKRKKTEDALRESEANYRLLAEHTKDTVWLMDMDLKLAYHSPSQETLRGLTHEEIREIPLEQTLTPESLKIASELAFQEIPRVEADPDYNPIHILELEYYRKDGATVWAEIKFSIIRDSNGKAVSILGEGRDITDRKRAEAYREMGREILQILNEAGDLQDSIQRVLATLKTRTGFDAVGIRLQDGDDFPYFVQQGFSSDFLLTENTLAERTADGGVCRDKDGNVSLECTCGLVISGKTDPANPLFTAGGSSWTNDSFPFLDVPPGEDPRHHPRNQCIHQGYASVALVPIHNRERIVGLIQLNDRRKGRFTLETIELLEAIASHIGEALMRKKAEEDVRKSEGRFKSIIEHVNDIFYIQNAEREILYISPQVEQMLGHTLKEMQNGWQNYLTDNPMNLAGPEKSQLAITTGEKQEPYLLEFIRSDGTKRLAEINESPLKDDKGEVTGIIGAARDITERKRAEDALRESEAKYRRIVETSIEGIIVIDSLARITFVNQQMASMLAYEVEELLGQKFESYLAEEEIEDHHAQMSLREQGKSAVYERCLRRKDGGILWAIISAKAIYDSEGRHEGSFGMLTDITERKQAEAALQQSEQSYRLLADHMRDQVWLMDLNLKPTYISPSVEKSRGYTFEEFAQLPLDEQLTSTSFQSAMEFFSNEMPKALSDPNYLARPMELEWYCKDGSTLWTENTFSQVRDKNGKLLSILGAGRDITERKQMEKLLIDNEARYRSLFENNPAAVYSVDMQGRFTSVNAAAMKLTGYSEEEALRISIADVVAPDYLDTMRSHFLDSLRGESQSYEAAIIAKDGRRIYVYITGTPIVIDGNIVGVYGISEDVTDRRRLEEEQQRVEKLESVGLLAGGIAHDFNNILTAILGNISLAGMEAQEGSELHGSLEEAQKAVLRAKDLTKQLLTFSRGGAPVMKLSSLTELLKDTSDFALRGSNVKCNFSIPADLWHAEIDAGQVSQVIHNLVINAQQAMPEGGTIELTAQNIALSETRRLGKGLPLKKGNYIRIAVADHGSGIPAQHMDRIFDPFFTTKQKGSGLGLATSFSIARQHGGHLSVVSTPNSGSTFYLYLPASRAKSTPRRDNKMETKPAGKARILVMDDEKGVREVAGRMLKHVGYQDIEFAADGAEAIKLYKAAMESGNPFTVAILDLTIPGGMGGKMTIKKLHKIDPGVKAIVSSGYVDDSVIAKYKEYGFSGMVAKPYTIEELRKALQDVIG